MASVLEDSPQTTLHSVIDGLRTQLNTFGSTLTDLEMEVAKQARDLQAVKYTPPPPSVTFAPNTAASADFAALQRKVSTFHTTLLTLVQMVQALSAWVNCRFGSPDAVTGAAVCPSHALQHGDGKS